MQKDRSRADSTRAMGAGSMPPSVQEASVQREGLQGGSAQAIGQDEGFYGVGDRLKSGYTKQEQYDVIREVERRCGKYLRQDFDPSSFIFPRDNFALTAHEPSICKFAPESSLDSAPLFTIAIPTYNRVEKLRRAILSALRQDLKEAYEIIVVENPHGTTYAASSMLHEEFYAKITYYQNTKNIGGLSNWNRCLELARGKWVCLLHSDDELLPRYLCAMRDLVLHPRYGRAFLIGAIESANAIYPRLARQKLASMLCSQETLLARQMQPEWEGGFCLLPPRAMLHNRQRCIEIGGYDEEEAPSGDMTFFNRAALAGEVYCYRGELLTKNHYEVSSCNDPHVLLMLILQNPQMFLGFWKSRRFSFAHLRGNFECWYQKLGDDVPLVKLYAHSCFRKQMELFGVEDSPSLYRRVLARLKAHTPALYGLLRACKALVQGRSSVRELFGVSEADKINSQKINPKNTQNDGVDINNPAQKGAVEPRDLSSQPSSHLPSPPPPLLNPLKPLYHLSHYAQAFHVIFSVIFSTIFCAPFLRLYARKQALLAQAGYPR